MSGISALEALHGGWWKSAMFQNDVPSQGRRVQAAGSQGAESASQLPPGPWREVRAVLTLNFG